MNQGISVVVLTHNDELRIVDCLECLNFADELIVVDDNSTDRTISLAKRYTDKIFTHPINSNFASQRNYALNQTHNPWVLFVDSDELVSEKLKKEILNVINLNEFRGYFIKRVDVMWGQKILHGEAGNVKLLRLAKKDSGKWHGKVHEEWRIFGKKGELASSLVHSPHPSVAEFISETSYYSTLRATELFESGHKVSFVGIIFYPFLKFIQNYIFRKGYKDKIPGLLYAIIMSFHSFLVRAKLFQLTSNG